VSNVFLMCRLIAIKDLMQVQSGCTLTHQRGNREISITFIEAVVNWPVRYTR